MKGSNIEILAPCGNWDSFLAGIENGADAVYLGGKSFSARQFADNFDREALKRAIQYAHAKGVKVYLAVNILISDREIKDALDNVREAYEFGIDGVIVQDLGFSMLIKDLFPDLPLHASTQMTVYDLAGVKKLEELGFKRCVLARELSIQEIAYICKNTSLEIEVFIHGALCISYSGQCLMSSIIGERSGNRGKCAQPCRLQYELRKISQSKKNGLKAKKGYILSPKDLCSTDYIKGIIFADVSSLKIEGRMKGAEYVGAVTKIYRKYVDKICKGSNVNVSKEDKNMLEQIFNRGYCSGYHFGNLGKELMCYKSNDINKDQSKKHIVNNFSKKIEEITKQTVISKLRKSPPNFDEKIRELFNFLGNSRNISEKLKLSAHFHEINNNIALDKLNLDRIYLPINFIYRSDFKESFNKLKRKGIEAFISIPSITRGAYNAILPKILQKAYDAKIDGMLVRNIGTIYKVHVMEGLKNFKIMGDFSLNIFNSFSVNEFLSMGLCGCTFSTESILAQIRDMKKPQNADYEAIAYGKIPIMKNSNCLVGSIYGGLSKHKKCSSPCKNGNFILKDRMGVEFPVVCDSVDCSSSILNSKVIFVPQSVDKIKKSGVNMLRLEFVDESNKEIIDIINMYHDLCKNGMTNIGLYVDLIERVKNKGFTKGHYFRGV